MAGTTLSVQVKPSMTLSYFASLCEEMIIDTDEYDAETQCLRFLLNGTDLSTLSSETTLVIAGFSDNCVVTMIKQKKQAQQLPGLRMIQTSIHKVHATRAVPLKASAVGALLPHTSTSAEAVACAKRESDALKTKMDETSYLRRIGRDELIKTAKQLGTQSADRRRKGELVITKGKHRRFIKKLWRGKIRIRVRRELRQKQVREAVVQKDPDVYWATRRYRRDQADKVYDDITPLTARCERKRRYSYLQKQFSKLKRSSQKVVEGKPSGCQKRRLKRERREIGEEQGPVVGDMIPGPSKKAKSSSSQCVDRVICSYRMIIEFQKIIGCKHKS